MSTHREAIRTARSLVVKVGTNALTTPSGVFDAGRLEATPAHDMASNLIYSMNGRMARDVLVDGEILVRNGKLTRMDEQVLVRDHRHRGKSKGSMR